MTDRFPLALCRQTDHELWFPNDGDRHSAEAAIRICRTCPHVSDCLNYALSMSENPAGVWGGLTGRQRANVRAKRTSGERP